MSDMALSLGLRMSELTTAAGLFDGYRLPRSWFEVKMELLWAMDSILLLTTVGVLPIWKVFIDSEFLYGVL